MKLWRNVTTRLKQRPLLVGAAACLPVLVPALALFGGSGGIVGAQGANLLSTYAQTGSTSSATAATGASSSSGSNSQAVPVNPQSDIGATTTIQNPGVVSWVHFGDLHITSGDQQNYTDLKAIISNANQYLKNGINFAVLPGDNANDGSESEYQLIKAATDQLQVPLYAVPGDHDHKGLNYYNQYMEPVDYQSFSAGGYHFTFLDVMSGISQDEMTWLTNDLDTASKAGLKSVIFMHSYNVSSSIQALIQKDNVIMIDAGHTHYNDVANDGNTIYAATRSTGQVTEGPVGFSIVNMDNGVISWKFKPLGSWPFVMITSPSDKQLMINGSQVVKGTTDIRAKIWDDKGVASATYQVDGGTAQPLQRIGTTQMWSVAFDSTKVSDGDHKITVNVTGAGGNTSSDTITVSVNQSGSAQVAQRSFGPSGNSIGAYTEKGLLGSHTSSGGAGGPGGAGKGAPGNCSGNSTNSGATGSATHGATTLPATTPTPGSSNSAPGSGAAPCGPSGTGGKGGSGAQGGGTAPSGGAGPVGGAGGKGGRGNCSGSTSGSNSSGATSSTTPSASATPRPTGTAGTSTGTSAGKGSAGGPCGPARPGGQGGPKGSGAPGAPGGINGGNKTATIVSVNGDQVTVKYSDGTQQVVTVGSSTQITKETTGSVSDLKAGETINLQTQSSGATPSGTPGTNATPGTNSGGTATQIEILP